MKCPVCEKELVWQGDFDLDEEDNAYGHYICLDCGKTEVFIYFKPIFNE